MPNHNSDSDNIAAKSELMVDSLSTVIELCATGNASIRKLSAKALGSIYAQLTPEQAQSVLPTIIS
jgi:hypothetical protein